MTSAQLVLAALKHMLKLTETDAGLIELKEGMGGLCIEVPGHIWRIHNPLYDISGREYREKRAPDPYAATRGSAAQHWRDHRSSAFCTWPDRSDNISFPVPAHGEAHNAEAAYFRSRTMWGITAYGLARIELLKHCVAHYEHMCEGL